MTFVKGLFLGVLALTATACGAASSSSPVAPGRLDSQGSSSLRLEQTAGELRTTEVGAVRTAAGARPGTLTITGIVLQDDGEFDVLQAAVVRAGLADALAGRRQYTVFAPTDAAFQRTLQVADEGAAIAAVNGLPLEALTDILLYHVTNGRRISASVLGAPRYQMLNGKTLTREELVAANIATPDISASNGVIHVIDAVLIP